MLSAKEFKDKWDTIKNGALIVYNIDEMPDLAISQETINFLTVTGLPETPPPYLEFKSSKGMLVNLTKKFNMSFEYQDYWFLGSTGSGDPICLKGLSGEVIFLNNGSNYEEVFINTTINQFAECILTYANMIDEVININGEDAYIDNDIPDDLIEWLSNEFRKIDVAAIDQDNFWAIEIENLKN